MPNLSGLGAWGRQAAQIFKAGGQELLSGRGIRTMPFLAGAAYGGYMGYRKGDGIVGSAMSAGMYGAGAYMGHSMYKGGALNGLGGALRSASLRSAPAGRPAIGPLHAQLEAEARAARMAAAARAYGSMGGGGSGRRPPVPGRRR